MLGLRFFLPVAIVLASAAALIASTMTSRADNNVQRYSFTNSVVPAAGGIDIDSIYFVEITAARVVENPVGCPAPTIAYSVEEVNAVINNIPVTVPFSHVQVRWSTPCVDIGESVVLEMDPEGNHTFYGTFLPSGGALTETPIPLTSRGLFVDCNLDFPGLQRTCTAPPGSVLEAGVVFVPGNTSFAVGSFDAKVSTLSSVPVPQPGTPDALNSNPDFNEAIIGSWICEPPVPETGEALPSAHTSTLACDTTNGGTQTGDGPTIAAGSSVMLGIVRYDIPANAEGASFVIKASEFDVADNNGASLLVPFLGNTSVTVADDLDPPPTFDGIILDENGTPIPTTTATPPVAEHILALDCDLAAPGIQSACTNFTGAATRTVGIVFVNESASDFRLSSFDIRVISPDVSTLNPQPGTGLFDGNPDFADDSFVNTWNCGVADNDTGENGAGTATSYLGCFTLPSTPELIAPGEQILVGTIDYDVPALATAGTTTLSFGQTFVAHSFEVSLQQDYTCTPFPESLPMTCLPASITLQDPPPGSTATPTPTFTPIATNTATPTVTPVVDSHPPSATPTAPFFLAFDCDVYKPGLQVQCTFPHNTSLVDVDVVLTSNSPDDEQLAAFNFIARNDNRALLAPVAGVDGNYDANPDFNEGVLPGNWTCALPTPSADTGTLGPTKSASFLSCFISGAGNVPLQAGESIALARVHYAVADPPAGPSHLDFDFVSVGNPVGNILINAGAPDSLLPGCSTSCLMTATIDVAPPPTPTPTPPGPRVEKIPEGNANNVDLAIPAANLWICAAGACDGAGEGELIIFEYASNVQTGDQDADSVADGLGAYEFSVEYDNFVIASVNAQDIVFNAGPITPYPGGADGVADGEGGARAPATCDMSIVTENIVHFGCVTAGQTPGPTGDFDLARLTLIPHEDLAADLFPGNDNGVVTIVKDNGCELVDVFGHPVAGSINGGLTPECGNLTVTVRILEGDLNLDCLVDVQDAQLMGFRYGAFFGSLLYETWYDLEPALHDLDIDIKDIQKVSGRNGSTCQEPIPPQPPQPGP